MFEGIVADPLLLSVVPYVPVVGNAALDHRSDKDYGCDNPSSDEGQPFG